MTGDRGAPRPDAGREGTSNDGCAATDRSTARIVVTPDSEDWVDAWVENYFAVLRSQEVVHIHA